MRIKRFFIIMFLIASIGYFFTKNDMFSDKQSFANESDTDGNAIIQDQTDLNDLKNEYDFPPFPSQVKIDKPKPTPDKTLPDVMPTTIEGGMVMRNDTSFDIDVNALLSSENNLKLSKDGVQVLIVHTHGSEAYSADKTSEYKPTDNYRTQDKNYSIIRVGDELTSCLESYGITVLHDRDIYDYPSYTGSYVRSGEAVEQYLSEHPEIKVVFDIHRDAIGSGDIIYKTLAEGDGKPSSQIMLLVGTGENGLYHPNWKGNLKFALDIQKSVVEKFPTLARPLALKKERYNQQLAPASILIEVGSSGNTLEEALTAIRLFADAAAPVLLGLTE